ncbi:MAG: DUF2946 family protein, partial [Burkholderiaceae bacterium]|nr:DUF2946 family protein [Burkholderiaceae bacterium]
YMRDDRCQRAGPFAPQPGDARPPSKGSRLLHDKLIAFIGRNYASDATGQWFFQNGPQRVYVELEATPWIWRVMDTPGHAVFSHTGRAAQVQQVWMDEQGRVYLSTDIGPGLVHSLDVGAVADALESGAWGVNEPAALKAEEAEVRWGFVAHPRPHSSAA